MKDPFIIQVGKIKDSRINDYTKNKFEGNIFPGQTDNESLKPLVEDKDINKFYILIVLGLSILFIRSIYLQTSKGDYYRNIAEGNRLRVQPIKASRGIIYDRNKIPLVKNLPRFSLSIIPADLPKDKNLKQETLTKLSQILKKPLSDLENLLKDILSYSYQPVAVEDNLDYNTALALKIESQKLQGIILNTENRREYLSGNEFSHVLGYLGKISPDEWSQKKDEYLVNDYLGKTGLEFFYEKQLKGVDGKKEIEVDSLGKEKRVVSIQPPIKGQNLISTIDEGLQKVLESSLESARPQKATAIALDPRNGEILAIVSYPNFDNNQFSQGIKPEDYQKLNNDKNQPFLFRAISGEYPSGSTIKLVISAAALEEKIIDEQTKIHSTGGIQVGDWFFGDWKPGGHGWVNVISALANSVNTFFYYVGGGYENFKGLGLDNIVKYTKLFGLDKKTGIDLPNESTGFVPTQKWKEEVKKEPWYPGDTYHLSIGQGDLLVTPLQVADYTMVIANGGTLYWPHLAKEFIDSENNQTTEIKPQSIRQNFIDPKNIEIVRKGLREAVISGSARAMADLPVKVGAKTGTAEVGGNKSPHAWFTCFAPYDNPEIVITILVENGVEGSTVALPVAKKVLSWYFSPSRTASTTPTTTPINL